MELHHLSVSRTARYHTLGQPGAVLQQVWILLHGYSQLAARFLTYFQHLDDGSRYLVAPEGLSRFYLDGTGGRIGASWMTREDRDHEIEDYVQYLDSVWSHVRQTIDGQPCSIHVLGFSQGVATACRWVCYGNVTPDHLVLWGEMLPPEMSSECVAPLRKLRLDVVYGVHDEFLTRQHTTNHTERLRRLGLRYRELTFEGGHRLDKETLTRLAE